MKLSHKHLELFMPNDVLSSLSPQEVREARRAAKRPFSFMVDAIRGGTENKGVWYLSLETPFKGEVFGGSQVSELDLLNLVDYDSSRVSVYYGALYRDRDSLWEQRADSVIYALSNENLSRGNAEVLLSSLTVSGYDSQDALLARLEEKMLKLQREDIAVPVQLSEFLAKI